MDRAAAEQSVYSDAVYFVIQANFIMRSFDASPLLFYFIILC